VTGRVVPGWAFAVGRGHATGYRLLLIPGFMTDGPEPGLLMSRIRGEAPASRPPLITTVVGADHGVLAVVYRTAELTRADVGRTDSPEAALLDRAGRPLVLTYGFLCRGVRVVAPDERDLSVARDAALATYLRFHAAEEDFSPETSDPYPVHSTVTSIDGAAAGRSPTTPAIAPWTAEAIPTPRPSPVIPRRGLPLAALLGVLLLIPLIAGLVLHDDTVQVPDVVNRPLADARRDISDAGLLADPDPVPEIDPRPPGTVIRTDPPGGTSVSRKSTVRLWTSSGPVPEAVPGTPSGRSIADV
jgi:hypothetical protein